MMNNDESWWIMMSNDEYRLQCRATLEPTAVSPDPRRVRFALVQARGAKQNELIASAAKSAAASDWDPLDEQLTYWEFDNFDV